MTAGSLAVSKCWVSLWCTCPVGRRLSTIFSSKSPHVSRPPAPMSLRLHAQWLPPPCHSSVLPCYPALALTLALTTLQLLLPRCVDTMQRPSSIYSRTHPRTHSPTTPNPKSRRPTQRSHAQESKKPTVSASIQPAIHSAQHRNDCTCEQWGTSNTNTRAFVHSFFSPLHIAYIPPSILNLVILYSIALLEIPILFVVQSSERAGGSLCMRGNLECMHKCQKSTVTQFRRAAMSFQQLQHDFALQSIAHRYA